MNKYILSNSEYLPTKWEVEKISSIKNTSFSNGKLDLNSDDPNYPTRSDLKIMRTDIIAAILTIKEMIKDFGLTPEEVSALSLFVGNGAFLDKPEAHLERMPIIYKKFTPEMSEKEKRKLIYRMVPPLVALETLTNSSMSFIAQYTGNHGNNATFGNTSLSTFHAITNAFQCLNDKAPLALISGMNCAGAYSFLTNSSISGYAENWKEGAAVGNLMVSNKHCDKALAEIVEMKSDDRIPNLETTETERNWKALIGDSTFDQLIFSGAFSEESAKLDQNYCDELHSNTISIFDSYGNIGAANIPVAINIGIRNFDEKIKRVAIIDRDIYGRESFILINHLG